MLTYVLIGNVEDSNFRLSFFIKSNISPMDMLLIVTFHTNMIQNKWLSYTIHRVILTCLGGPFFPKTVNK